MTRAIPRITVRRLMAVIAVLALVLGACRENLFAGIFAACVACGTYARSHGAIVRRIRSGRDVTAGQKIRVVLSSLLVMTTILGAADLIAWVGMLRGMRWPRQCCIRGDEDLYFFGGPALAVLVASRLRRWLWPCEIRDDPPA